MAAKKKKPKALDNKEKKINNPKGKNADKLRLNISFDEAMVRAVNMRIKVNKKNE